LQVITGWRRFSERLGGGASIFQDLDLGEVLWAEARLRPTEGGGKHLPVGRAEKGLHRGQIPPEIARPEGPEIPRFVQAEETKQTE
jgi:hypothetical protein